MADDPLAAGPDDPGALAAPADAWLDTAWAWIDSVWNFQLFRIDEAWVTPGQLIIALAIMFAGMFISRLLSRRFARRVLARFGLAEGTRVVVQTISFYLLLVITVLLALQTAGVPLTVFTIFGGAIALGIGFGSQNIVNNFISGLIMMIERPVKIGDFVEVDGHAGRVIQIGARCMVITDYRGVCHLIPNSHVLEQAVVNWHWNDRKVATVIEVGFAYGSATAKAKETLLAIAEAEERVVSNPDPEVLFTGFGDNTLNFELLVWVAASSTMERLRIESDLRFAVDTACRAAELEIAFPQRDVHLDVTGPVDVRVNPTG